MNIIKPKKLKKNSTISIIAPAGEVDTEKINCAKQYFEQLGYSVKLGKNIKKHKNYLAGEDEERLSDLHEAFEDNEVDAIICARGGDGALRLIDKINYDLIAKNPKIFCGFSDITILNNVIFKMSGLINFHGAMAQSDFSNPHEICDYTKDTFFDALCGKELAITPNNPKIYGKLEHLKARIIGGNLSSLCSICPVDFVPDEDFIFFAEDLNEPVYKIDRYFTQLFHIEKFKNNIKAVLLGDFINIDDEPAFNDLIDNISKTYGIIVIKGYPFSHERKKATVPVGAIAELNDTKLIIRDFMV